MITYRMHILRTGRTFLEAPRPYVGQSDPPLCLEGIEELEQLRRECAYPRVEAVFTSPLRRCVQTADILYPDVYAETVDGLRDMSLGRFEGHTLEELQDDGDFTAWLKNSAENPPPGGERAEDFTRRIVTAVNGLFRRMMDDRMTNIAVITHGGVIMSLLAGIGLPKQPIRQWATPNGEGYTLLFSSQMWMRDRCAEIFARQPQPAADGWSGRD